MSKQKPPDSELDAQRKRLAKRLDQGLDDVEAGRVASHVGGSLEAETLTNRKRPVGADPLTLRGRGG
jgi:hypothetical protein